MLHVIKVDINPRSTTGWDFTTSSLRALCEKGAAKLIRLDAFGYVTKKAGTSCFMLVSHSHMLPLTAAACDVVMMA